MPLDRDPTLQKRFAYATVDFKQVQEEPSKTWFEGIASTPTPDLSEDELDPKGAEFTLPMAFLYHHDTERPLGQITEAKVSAAGIKVKGYVERVEAPPTLKERLDVARVEMKTGLMRGLSIGWVAKEFDFKNDGGLRVRKWKWAELSGVTVPMQQEATITMVKSLDRKAANGATDLPLSDRLHAWDATAADERVRKWASSDGSGDKDKINWSKYASAHFWKEPGNTEAFGGYKLQFADVINGTLTAVWRGVTQSAAVMQGARGGVDIPEADRAGVRSKIENYYGKAKTKYKDDSIEVPWAGEGKQARAASGTISLRAPAPSPTPQPGEAGSKAKGQAMSNQAERLSAWEAKRAALAAQAVKIMDDAEKDGDRSLTEDESKDYERLISEVKTADEHIKRIRDSESVLLVSPRQSQPGKEAAKTVPPRAGEDEAAGSRARAGDFVMRPQEKPIPGIGMARYVKALAYAKGNYGQAIEYAKMQPHWATTPDVELALKAAIAAGTSSDVAWAGPLVYNQNLAAEFVEYLRPATIIGRIPGFRMVPFNIRFPTQTGGSTVGWVGEGKPKPVSKLAFSSASLGFAKAAGIVIVTMELARFSSPSAELLVRDDLTAQMAQFLDVQFIDPGVVAVANVNPASITNGAGNVRQAAGIWNTQANVLADVNAFLQTFATNNIQLDATARWVMTPSLALSLSMIVTTQGAYAFPGLTVDGGTFVGIPVITSNSVPSSVSAGSIAVLVKANEVFMADDGAVAIDVSQEASLQMDSAPTNDSVTPTATTLVSMFQTNSLAIRAERVINWARRRAMGVGYIDNIHTS